MIYPVRVATDEQIQYARQYLEQGGIANRGDFDGDYHQQFFGILAQIVVQDYFGVPRPEYSEGFDGGYDFIYFNDKYDVKCELRTTDFKPRKYVHNLVASQLNYDVDYYYFVSYNRVKGEFTLCGRISKSQVLKYAEYFSRGSLRTRDDGTTFNVQAKGGMYEIKQRFLEYVEPLIPGWGP